LEILNARGIGTEAWQTRLDSNSCDIVDSYPTSSIPFRNCHKLCVVLVHCEREFLMSEMTEVEEKVPMMQQLLDNPFLLLFLGVMIPMIVYVLWGVIDILTIPLAP
jgi:hypothetical protein